MTVPEWVLAGREHGDLLLTALFDPDPAPDEWYGLRCERADDLIAIAREYWEMALRGEMRFTEAGEGLFTVSTVDGVLRYALTGQTTRDCRALLARRLTTPAQQPDTFSKTKYARTTTPPPASPA